MTIKKIEQNEEQHDFDYSFGTWRTELSRLIAPLTGSTEWAEYEGTSTVRKVWDGRANLIELDVEGPAGRLEGLSLRLYNPLTRQWSLNYSNSRVGVMAEPVTGGFTNEVGKFFGQTIVNNRDVYVKFVITKVSADVWRYEQSFSDNGGETWEKNWIAVDTRIDHDPESTY